MMSMDSRPGYWLDYMDEWAIYDEKTETFSIKPDAPEKIKESFGLWKELNPQHAA